MTVSLFPVRVSAVSRRADAVRNALRGAFGPSAASVLTLNSRGIPGCTEPPLPDVWGPLIKDAEITARDTTQRSLQASQSFGAGGAGAAGAHAEYSSPTHRGAPRPHPPPQADGGDAAVAIVASASAGFDGGDPLGANAPASAHAAAAASATIAHPLQQGPAGGDVAGAPPPLPARGLMFTEGDHAGVKAFVEEFVRKTLLPFLEQKARGR